LETHGLFISYGPLGEHEDKTEIVIMDKKIDLSNNFINAYIIVILKILSTLRFRVKQSNSP